MTLRFSRDGPYFPGDLVDSLFAGEVVFLCGAGVSAPSMPNFCELVKSTYETIGVEKTPQEKMAFEDGRFEEVLASLSRRLADPNKVISTISELLANPKNLHVKRHHIILRLSRDLENRICVVTTNFDTLFERAEAKNNDSKKLKVQSFAGQDLPAPGSSNFAGILHIHGRLEDEELQLKRSNLIVTSEHYGDAYMRSGWASRFLFDLARCKVIVLVGYSANDPPIRYFLNVLEADRARFPDIKKIYALHAENSESQEAWDLLAVEPIPYPIPDHLRGSNLKKEDRHIVFWHDLNALADAIERPKQFRQERAQKILKHPFGIGKMDNFAEIKWLLCKYQDLQVTALNAISDPKWFKHFQDEKFYPQSILASMIATWIAKDFQNIEKLACACEWEKRLGRSFTEEIERKLFHKKSNMDANWFRLWRFFCLSDSNRSRNMNYYYLLECLTDNIVLDSDLRKAVNLLAPTPEFDWTTWRTPSDEKGKKLDHSPLELPPCHMAVPDDFLTGELINALNNMPARSLRILQIATSELESSLRLEVELGKIDEEGDCNDWEVPSIENHCQNKDHEGVNHLVRVVVNCLPQAIDLDLERTKKIVAEWKNLPGRIGSRLYFHAMRDNRLFDANDAISTLLTISHVDFWKIRKEIALFLRDQAKNALLESQEQVKNRILQVEKRILDNGSSYYNRISIEHGQPDWRPRARDRVVWLRLKMLQEAGVLSKDGHAELSDITKRCPHLNREVEDSDFFDVYSSGSQLVVGDPKPILKVPTSDRLQIAHKLADSPIPDTREGWAAFCRSDPQGALNSLLEERRFKKKNLPLWGTFLVNLPSKNDQNMTLHEGVPNQAMKYLAKISTKKLQPIAFELCDLIHFGQREKISNLDNWLIKLWKLIIPFSTNPLRPEEKLYEKIINSPAGKIAETLLKEIEKHRKNGKSITITQCRLLKRISSDTSNAGDYGCALFAHYVAFLLNVNQHFVTKKLAPRINAKNAKGKSLRAMMLTGMITPEVTAVFKDSIIKGIVESKPVIQPYGKVIAANILRPILAGLKDSHPNEWALTATDVKHALRQADLTIQVNVLTVLANWLRNDRASAEDAWIQIAVPFFEKIWPKERKFVKPLFTNPMINLIVGAGEKFPEAYEFMKFYICPYDRGHQSLHVITKSEVPEKFPHETLDLLRRVCGPRSRGEFRDLSEVIDRLIKAKPSIEVDRRLQWLAQRADGYRHTMASSD